MMEEQDDQMTEQDLLSMLQIRNLIYFAMMVDDDGARE